MKMIRSSFAALLAAVAAIGWSVAFAFDNQIADVSVDQHNVISSPGDNLLGLDTATADTGMPPPLIVVTFVHSDQVGSVPTISMFDTVGQNGHYRDSVATVPPLIHAMSLDKVMDLSSNAISGADLAGGTMYDTSQTNDGWSDSGAQSTDISPAVNTDPPEIPAPQSA